MTRVWGKIERSLSITIALSNVLTLHSTLTLTPISRSKKLESGSRSFLVSSECSPVYNAISLFFVSPFIALQDLRLRLSDVRAPQPVI